MFRPNYNDAPLLLLEQQRCSIDVVCGARGQRHAAGQGRAVALTFSNNPNPWPAYPSTMFYWYQSVYQFPSAKAAGAYFTQARAKYAACNDFTESVPASSVPGSGALETTTQTISKAAVGTYQSFEVGQLNNLSEAPGTTINLNTMVTLEGTDVFTMVSVGGTNDPVPADLMLKLINRVKALR